MTKSRRVKGLLALVSVVALSLPAVSQAGVTESGTREARIHVSYADLDLSKAAGVTALYTRLKVAAQQACGPTNLREVGSVQRAQKNKACYNSLLSRAVAKLDNDYLAAMHAG
ncbi:MAG: hypothetical protein BMS9Abin32_603 [Gammaproteobacteria bacterium]|nr:MAG: hypothetical protein BMS9Abin32_603 [Gammaproteobacteria bacterium]